MTPAGGPRSWIPGRDSWLAEAGIVGLALAAIKYLLEYYDVKGDWAISVGVLGAAQLLVLIRHVPMGTAAHRFLLRWRIAEWTGISRAFPIKQFPHVSGGAVNRDQQANAEQSLRELWLPGLQPGLRQLQRGRLHRGPAVQNRARLRPHAGRPL